MFQILLKTFLRVYFKIRFVHSGMKPGQRDIYYLAAPSRQLAESSPYFEALKTKDVEILFCFESYDELVLMQLQQV